MDGHDIIVVGASAGGIGALQGLLHHLPAELPAAVFIVQHLAANSPGLLPGILGRALAVGSRVTVSGATEGEPIALGSIVVAPPDHHLLVERGRMRVVRGPRENLHRPAIDVLFRSAALAYGSRVVGVVLSGALDDGTAGLGAIKRRGGVSVVQEPGDAAFPSMPLSAIANVPIDHRLPVAGIARLLAELAGPGPEASPPSDSLALETAMAVGRPSDEAEMERLGELSPFTCPECHGPLWQIEDGELIRLRCHVGHAFSLESLQSGQAEAQERALWAALRALEEQVLFYRRLGDRSRGHGHGSIAVRYDRRAEEHDRDAATIREMLRRSPDGSADGNP